MNVLVTGANGQLGKEFGFLSNNYKEFNFFLVKRKDLDITNKNTLKVYFQENKIDAIINCAAYTAVDLAEEEKEQAMLVNGKSVQFMVDLAEELNLKLIHFSTDYVFNGKTNIPYNIDEIVDPVNYYGVTKRVGEESIINSNSESIVIRTSWVYSTFGKNFVKTINSLSKDKEVLTVVEDQIGSPTYARDLATAVLEILANKNISEKGKIYHYANEGICSWYDLAKAIVEINGSLCKVLPVDSNTYKTTAKRPHYSVMNKKAIKRDFQVEIPYWRDSLKQCLKEL